MCLVDTWLSEWFIIKFPTDKLPLTNNDENWQPQKGKYQAKYKRYIRNVGKLSTLTSFSITRASHDRIETTLGMLQDLLVQPLSG